MPPVSACSTSRRRILFGVTGAILLPSVSGACHAGVPQDFAAELEEKIGGRLGLFALDTESGKRLEHRADERFPMCSTFKWALAAATLERVDKSELALTDRVQFTRDALLDYAPVAARNLHRGFLSIQELASAAVTVSDNTATNLLLSRLGGPGAVTSFARSHGDNITRLDRNEPSLNTNQPDDPRDTTSPRAMVGLMQSVLCGTALKSNSKRRLLRWLLDCETGDRRLRAGLPKHWSVGDKTGTGPGRTVKDVAIAIPPKRRPILIALYLRGSTAETDTLEAAHAAVAEWVASTFVKS